MYTENQFLHCYHTRNDEKFYQPMHKHHLKKSYHYSGISLYNSLTNNFKSIKQFKRHLSILRKKNASCGFLGLNIYTIYFYLLFITFGDIQLITVY